MTEVSTENPFGDSNRNTHVEFTQYLLPDGQKVSNPFLTTAKIGKLADDIIKAGYRFEVEILRTGDISATIVGKLSDSKEEEGDVVMKVMPNNPFVGSKVDAMIREFHMQLFPGEYHG